MCQGTAPIFGFPPICYSPPNELKQAKGKHEYLGVLMRHVFHKTENLASVEDLINAKEEEDNFIDALMKRFMTGKKRD